MATSSRVDMVLIGELDMTSVKLSFVLLLTAIYLSTADAEDLAVTVKVVEAAHKSPVVGMVILNPEGLRVGKTRQDGVLAFEHKCQLGQTLKAEPEEGAKYYNSLEQVCADEVVLEVFPRPKSHLSEATFVAIRKVPGTQGPTYAGMFTGLTERVETISGEHQRCKLTIESKAQVGYFNEAANDWRPLPDRGVPWVLPQEETSTYYFPSSCENAGAEISAIKRSSNAQLESRTPELLNMYAREIGAAALESITPPR